MIGIYKITSPTGRVYIGQSIDIKNRFREYKRLDCKTQPKLLRSLTKHGVKSHKFEVIKECNKNILSPLEYYFQELYNSVDTGLNCVYEKPSGIGSFISKETRKKQSIAKKGVYVGNKNPMYGKLGILSPNYGRKHSEETKRKISEGNKGKVYSEETRIKISLANKGRVAHNKGVPMTEIQKDILRKANLGRRASKETREKMSKIRLGRKLTIINPKQQRGGENHMAKKIINIKTLDIFECCTDISSELGLKPDTFRKYLSGKLRNKTDYIYLEKYKSQG